jgi:hypothetical protein
MLREVNLARLSPRVKRAQSDWWVTVTLGCRRCYPGDLTSDGSSFECPGIVDQKNPLQSGSSKMYGKIRVNKRTQFRTGMENMQ